MTIKQFILYFSLALSLLIGVVSCASNRYKPKSVRRTRRCGDCPRFSKVEYHTINTTTLALQENE